MNNASKPAAAHAPGPLAIVNGWPVTANEDGRIPINAKCVEIEQIVSDYTALRLEVARLREALEAAELSCTQARLAKR